jgi:hypothetical protein
VGETLTVDKAKLREAAKKVDDAARLLEEAAGDSAVPQLAVAEAALAGSVTDDVLPRIGRGLSECASDMMSAMLGLAQGLESAARRFDTVDMVYGRAARPDAVIEL